MPQIFELFGFPLIDDTQAARSGRANAFCPFMGRVCDGGGNRYSSHLHLARLPEVLALYPGRETLPAGVCSIRLVADGEPWIVCPRRLMALNRNRQDGDTHQGDSESRILRLLRYPAGTTLGVWSEVKLMYKQQVRTPAGNRQKKFDYTFDYVLMPLGRVTQEQAVHASGIDWGLLSRHLRDSGFTIAQRERTTYIEDFPTGIPSIIEIMTSSTSGGNKAKRTTIANAVEDALRGNEHKAPGINYRQVWARMVSQLIVKSEVALNWGGRTIWLVQDVLVDYICASTALDVRQFLAEGLDEVNVLSLTYGNKSHEQHGVIELGVDGVFAGPMAAGVDGANVRPSFQDMVRAVLKPEITRLVKLLVSKRPLNRIATPRAIGNGQH
jgi:hypothetical protein